MTISQATGQRGKADKPQRIQRRRTKGWRMPEGAVYVGRPTKWGNPWKVGEPGPPDGHPVTAQEAVDLFALHSGPFGDCELSDEDLAELRGHDLVCWCPLDQPCHADVLLELANS